MSQIDSFVYDFSKMTVVKLQEFAKINNIKMPSRMRKQDIIALIKKSIFNITTQDESKDEFSYCNTCMKTLPMSLFVSNKKAGSPYKTCYDCRAKKANQIKKCKCGKHVPSFNLPGETTAIWCLECKHLGAVNVVSKKCYCGKHQPTFNLPGETKAIWCFECKQSGAIDITHEKCHCGKHRPKFNLPGELKPIWCSECKDPNAINITDEKCQCGKHRPNFNLPGELKPIWCSECKDPNAINITSERCKCGKHIPVFNLPGETKAIWCSECKEQNAVNIKDKLCQCGEHIPTFNLPGELKRIWCSKCKDPNAINVKSKRCECGKHVPIFNLPGETKAIWCSECKDSKAINVKSKKCWCGIIASYGIAGQIVTMCAQHRSVDMIYKSTQQCKNENCRNLAIYGDRTKRLRCEDHKLDGDFNLIEKRCIACGLMEVLNENNYCSNCEPGKYLKYVKRHEMRIKDLFVAQNLVFINDRIPNTTNCGKERPDFVFDPDKDEGKNYQGPHIVIVEVDEDQHNQYDIKCEKTRMFNVTQGFGGIPVFWIRYNPDKFRLPDGTKSKITQYSREAHLLEWVRYAFKRPYKKLLEVIYLFYDGCTEQIGEDKVTSIEYQDLQ